MTDHTLLIICLWIIAISSTLNILLMMKRRK